MKTPEEYCGLEMKFTIRSGGFAEAKTHAKLPSGELASPLKGNFKRISQYCGEGCAAHIDGMKKTSMHR